MRLIIFSSILLCFTSCSTLIKRTTSEHKNNECSIKIEVNGVLSPEKTVVINDGLSEQVIAKYALKDSIMTFKYKYNEPRSASIYFLDNNQKPIYTSYKYFYIEGKSLYIKGAADAFSKATVVGGTHNQFFEQLNMDLSAQEKNNLIYQKPNSPVSLDEIIYQRAYLTKDSLTLFYNKLNKNYKHSILGEKLHQFITQDTLKVGDVFPSFVGYTLEGKFFQASTLKSNLIILDFWAFNCPPCRKQNRTTLKTIFNTYDSKEVQIIGFHIGNQSDSLDWYNASLKDSIKWINVSDFQGYNSPIVKRCDIFSVPTTYVLNKNRVIKFILKGYHPNELETLIEHLKNDTR